MNQPIELLSRGLSDPSLRRSQPRIGDPETLPPLGYESACPEEEEGVTGRVVFGESGLRPAWSAGWIENRLSARAFPQSP